MKIKWPWGKRRKLVELVNMTRTALSAAEVALKDYARILETCSKTMAEAKELNAKAHEVAKCLQGHNEKLATQNQILITGLQQIRDGRIEPGLTASESAHQALMRAMNSTWQ